jgi:hypothetical protein
MRKSSSIASFSSVVAAGLLLAGCASNEPTWALDVTFVAPSDAPDAALTGSQTWQVYRRAWQRSFKGRHYLCSVFVVFDATGTTPDCPDCLAAYDVVPEVGYSDCSDALTADPVFTSLTRIGFGPVSDSPTAPYPDASSPAYADYGLGWEVHGWAWPEGVSEGDVPDVVVFDGTQPFDMAPAFAWQLTGGSATSTSRLAVDPEDDGSP